METILLIGTEAVESAGRQMASAAEEMLRAAATLEHTLEMHQRFLDDWLMRLEEIMKKEG